ncbi:MAG: tRNA pseudouridine(38-40) synthase TruA [Leeuwenhoekiella sp.]
MFRKRYYYLIKVQYLGFRYHGWQKQPEVLTVERMMQRTFQYVLQHNNFKLLAAGRTDAKVSVNETYIELFLDEDPIDSSTFLPYLNQNLPQDIKALSIEETTAEFNIIQQKKTKEYLYLFSQGAKIHPFCAPFMVHVAEQLDIELMQKAAKAMEGTHDFVNFTFKPKPETQTVVTIDCCEVVTNDIYTANFFPSESYLLRVKGAGFKRHQIRLMMGALIDLGTGNLEYSNFQEILKADKKIKLTHIAKASGLILQSVNMI